VLLLVGLLFSAGVYPLIGVAMSILGLEIPNQRVGFLVGSAVLVVIGVALIVLAPTKQSVERLSAASA